MLNRDHIIYFGTRPFCLPKDILPKDILPNGRFADRHFAERTFCQMDVLPNGHFAERTTYRDVISSKCMGL